MPTNIAISQDTSNPFSECDIRINPSNTQQIIAGSNANNGSTQAQYWSNDGGTTWNQVSLPSVSPDNFQSDPSVDWTSDGNAWALTIGVQSGISSSTLTVRSFKSTDGGKTWTSDSHRVGYTNRHRQTHTLDRPLRHLVSLGQYVCGVACQRAMLRIHP